MKALAAKKREVDREAAAVRKSLKSQVKEVDKSTEAKRSLQKRRRGDAKNVYDAIGFDLMFETGICQVEEGLFSQTVNFSDVSYQSADTENQEAILDQYAGVFDGCGPDVHLQVMVVNTPIPESKVGNQSFFNETGDPQLDKYVAEYNDVLNRKTMEGISNIIRNRYITYSVHADTYADAVPKLQRVYTAISSALERMGSSARKLDGAERLKLIADMTRPYEEFSFDYKNLLVSNLTAKDFVCPVSLNFRPDRLDDVFKANNVWCQALVIRKIDAQLQDLVISDLIDLPIPMGISLHVHPLEKGEGRNLVRRELMWIDKEIIEEQQKAVRKGYDFNNLPIELKYSKADGEELLNELQYKNQNLYEFTGIIFTYAHSFEQLRDHAVRIVNTAHQQGIEVEALDSLQREALNSVIPVGNNHIGVTRRLTTTQVAMFIPFATSELNEPNGGYYGQNKVSNNLILMNRSKLAAPMGWVFGQPGSGKSFGNKREVTNNYLSNPTDEFMIIDPKDEYSPLVKTLGGTAYALSLDSKDQINVFDFYDGLFKSGGANPIDHKSETIQALASVVMGAGEGELTAEERSVVDRCVRLAYMSAAPGEIPMLEDFHAQLKEQPEPEAKRLATAFELYVTGGLRYFNAQTTVELDKRITSFSFQKLGASMKLFAMIIIMDYVYNRMLYNFKRGVRTWLYIDEVQSLFTTPNVVEYFDKFWAEGRSYNLVPTAITQTPERVINHETAKYLIRNSDFILIYKLSPIDRGPMAELLGLSPQQEQAIGPNAQPGEGLLVAGASTIAFTDDWPKGRLYDLWNTKPEDLAEINKATWQAERREEAMKARALAESAAAPASGKPTANTGSPVITAIESEVPSLAREEAFAGMAGDTAALDPEPAGRAEAEPDEDTVPHPALQGDIEGAAAPGQPEGIAEADKAAQDDNLKERAREFFSENPEATIARASEELGVPTSTMQRLDDMLDSERTLPERVKLFFAREGRADVQTAATALGVGVTDVMSALAELINAQKPDPEKDEPEPEDPAGQEGAGQEGTGPEEAAAPHPTPQAEAMEEEGLETDDPVEPDRLGEDSSKAAEEGQDEPGGSDEGARDDADDPDDEAPTGSEPDPTAAEGAVEKAVRDCVNEHPGSKVKEISAMTGIDARLVRETIERLQAETAVTHRKPGKKKAKSGLGMLPHKREVEIPRGETREGALFDEGTVTLFERQAEGNAAREETRGRRKNQAAFCAACVRVVESEDGTCPNCGAPLG